MLMLLVKSHMLRNFTLILPCNLFLVLPEVMGVNRLFQELYAVYGD